MKRRSRILRARIAKDSVVGRCPSMRTRGVTRRRRIRCFASASTGDDAERGARETYASVLIVNDADREVNLNGVTVQFEFSKLIRLDDAASEFTTLGEFEFTCWGSQIVSPSGARRIVDCGDLSVQMNDIGPRVVVWRHRFKRWRVPRRRVLELFVFFSRSRIARAGRRIGARARSHVRSQRVYHRILSRECRTNVNVWLESKRSNHAECVSESSRRRLQHSRVSD